MSTTTQPSSPFGAPPAPGGDRGPGRPVLGAALVVAVAVLLGSVAMATWLANRSTGPARTGYVARSVPGPGMVGGGNGRMHGGSPITGGGVGAGMMSGRIWLAGDGAPVTSIAAAKTRATQAASPQGLHPGEVIWFSNGFYVELVDATGASETEVLVDPVTGAVTTEAGPATMWNTGSRDATISPDQARSIAATWLQAHRPDESVSSIDAYPGYYTLDTQLRGKPVSMLSVHARTGAVWYHTWHGSFVAEEDT